MERTGKVSTNESRGHFDRSELFYKGMFRAARSDDRVFRKKSVQKKPRNISLIFLIISMVTILTMGLLIFPTVAFAQSVQVEATVDRNQVNVGDTFTYSIAVTSKDNIDISDPQMPSLQNFEVLHSWTSSEARSTFSSGQGYVSTQTQRFNFQLVPLSEGRLQIGSAQIQIEGKIYRTAPVSIEAFGAQSGRRGQQAPSRPSQQAPSRNSQQGQQGRQDQNQADPFDMEDAFNQLLQDAMGGGAGGFPGRNGGGQNGGRSNGVLPDEKELGDLVFGNSAGQDFFIGVRADKREVLVGEQVTVSWYLYSKGQVVDIDTLKYPVLKGFWKEDMELATQLNFQPEIINGVRYQRALLARYALFPIEAGQLSIDPYQAKVSIVANPFGFGGKTTKTKQSEPIKITALPLPVPKPKNFFGAVGLYGLVYGPDNQQVVQGQPFTVRLKIEGLGNAKLIEQPQLVLPSGIEVYDVKAQANFFKNGRSFKEFQFILVSKDEGVKKFEGFKLEYFDPKQKKYVEAKAEDFSLQFAPGAINNQISNLGLNANQVSPAPNKEKMNKKSELQPLIIDENGKGVSKQISVQQQLWTSGVLFLLALIALLTKAKKELGWGERKQNIEHNLARRIKRITELAGQSDVRNVGAQLLNLINYVLGQVTETGGASLELNRLLEVAPPSVRRELGAELAKAMELYQTLSFAPGEILNSFQDKTSLRKIVNEAEVLLKKTVQLAFKVEDYEK